MNNSLKVGSFNTWCGCKQWVEGDPESTIDFIVDAAHEHDLLFLQEVHVAYKKPSKRFAHCKDGKWRPGPIDLELGKRLISKLYKTHLKHFVAHFSKALHDCEAIDEPVHYGNLLFIKKNVEVLKYSSHQIFGNRNLFEKRAMKSRPAARSSQVVTIMFKGKPLTIEGVHGLWSDEGKVDLPARTAQSARIIGALETHRRNLFCDSNPLIAIIGDLNYHDKMQAFQDLLSGLGQLGNGAENINERFGITDTRTDHYPADKPTRQADFLMTTTELAERVYEYTGNRNTPSDHAFMTGLIT